jgi:hypothetical protein
MIISGRDLSWAELFGWELDISVRINELAWSGVATELVGVVPTEGVDFVVVGDYNGMSLTNLEELDVGISVVALVLESEDLDGPKGVIDVGNVSEKVDIDNFGK